MEMNYILSLSETQYCSTIDTCTITMAISQNFIL